MAAFLALAVFIGSEYAGWHFFGKIGLIVVTALWLLLIFLASSDEEKGAFLGCAFIIGLEYAGWRFFGKNGVIGATVIWIGVGLIAYALTPEEHVELYGPKDEKHRLKIGMRLHRFDNNQSVECEIIRVLDEKSAIVRDQYGQEIRISRENLGMSKKGKVTKTHYSYGFFVSDTGQRYYPR
ncbi:MAG: hypothetical protein IKO14_08495 [Oscillibacter sp.]|nr:hypothetical protein [Oscillibacter sp.]